MNSLVEQSRPSGELRLILISGNEYDMFCRNAVGCRYRNAYKLLAMSTIL